jgi:transposase
MTKYISSLEAAERLGVHQTTVQRWIRDGHLIGRKRGPAKQSPYAVSEDSVAQLQQSLELETSPN